MHLTHAVKAFYRQEATDRVGKGRYCDEEDLRICSTHEFETIKKRIEVTHGDLRSQDIEINVVVGADAKSSLTPSADNKGLASDRHKEQVGNKLQKQKNTYRDYNTKNSKANSKKRIAEGVLKQAEGLVAETLLALQQAVEHSE